MARKSNKKITPSSPNLKTLAARMKHMRLFHESRDKESGLWQQKACAKRADMPYQLWNDVERGKIKSPTYANGKKIAEVLEVTVGWLYTGKNESSIRFIAGAHEEKIPLDENYPIIQLYAPIVNWQQAGRTVLSGKDVSGVHKRVQRYQGASRHSFVLIVDGDSMVNPDKGKTTFLPGDMLHFDPASNSRKPNPGDYVIARDESEKTAIFRQYITDCGKPFLKAFNPYYPLIEVTESTKIFGILIFQGRDLRS